MRPFKGRCAAAGLAIAGLCLPIAGSGYTIGQKKPLHERLAALSAQCVDTSPVIVAESYGERISCPFDHARLRASRKTTSRFPSRQTPIEAAARWGDDPGRGLNRSTSGVDYLWRFGIKCPRAEI